MGWGIPLPENKKVSWILGFLFLGLLVSKFLGFKVLKEYFSFRWEILVPYYQACLACFQADIDPIFKIFKKR